MGTIHSAASASALLLRRPWQAAEGVHVGALRKRPPMMRQRRTLLRISMMVLHERGIREDDAGDTFYRTRFRAHRSMM